MVSLQQQVARLKAAVAVRQRGAQLVIRVIDEDPDGALDRIVAAGSITETQRDQVMVIQRMPLAPSPRTKSGTRMADPNPSFRRQIEYPKDGNII